MDINNLNKLAEEVYDQIIKEKGSTDSIQANVSKGLGVRDSNDNYDKSLASKMEHSMIIPSATPAMVKQFCNEAIRYGFRNVSLAPCFVSMAYSLLRGTGVNVSTAVAFPMGIATKEMKVAETLEVIRNGAVEIDLPINIGMVKAGEFGSIRDDIQAVVSASNKRALIKAVIDLGALSEEECIKVAQCAKSAGADFLKVAATTRPIGVNADDMRFFRGVVGDGMGLKADGGIRDYKTALAVIESGGTTIGASSSVKIVTTCPDTLK
ncbi:MAG: deoxyribose-phosphate aldolase [Clostridiales bacterium]|nr:deoxyribose-phosphate aldolase [Clostridiales bacterium]